MTNPLNSDDFSELRLEGVSRAFGKSAALADLTLTVKRGEFVALLGPSGSGKSTALNCIAGLLPLTAGVISLDDRRVDHLAPEQRGFGMVFQNYALFPHLTVRGNIAFGLKMRKVPKAEITRRVDAALALVQLSAHADKQPAQLSGGQQQRVAIARAVVVEPLGDAQPFLRGGDAAVTALTGLSGWCPVYHARGVTSLNGPGDHPDEAERTAWLALR